MVGAHEGYCFSFRTKTLQFWQRNHFYFSSNAREKYVCRWTIKCGKERKKKFTIKQKHPLAKYRHTFSQIWHTKFDMQIHVVISIFAVWRTRNNNRERKKSVATHSTPSTLLFLVSTEADAFSIIIIQFQTLRVWLITNCCCAHHSNWDKKFC